MDSKWLRNSFVYLILLVAVVALALVRLAIRGGIKRHVRRLMRVLPGDRDPQ
jgi:hypothetical protein